MESLLVVEIDVSGGVNRIGRREVSEGRTGLGVSTSGTTYPHQPNSLFKVHGVGTDRHNILYVHNTHTTTTDISFFNRKRYSFFTKKLLLVGDLTSVRSGVLVIKLPRRRSRERENDILVEIQSRKKTFLLLRRRLHVKTRCMVWVKMVSRKHPCHAL